MTRFATTLAVIASVLAVTSANASTVTVGPGGFDNGYATTITYDPDAARGTSFQRDNALNALGAPDGSNPGDPALNGGFFEIGLGSQVDLTFGTLFDTSTTVFEITFGDPAGFPEAAQLLVGLNGVFTAIGTISNQSAANAIGATIGLGTGVFDTVRLIDVTNTSASVGGFDIDAVRVVPAPVPLPAGFALMLAGLGGFAVVRGRKARA